MAYGLQIFDAAGNVIVDVVDRLTRFHSKYTVTVQPGATVFVAVAGMDNNGLWVVVPGATFSANYIELQVKPGGFQLVQPVLVFSEMILDITVFNL